MYIVEPLTVSWMHIQKTSGWIGDFLLKKYCTSNSTKDMEGTGRTGRFRRRILSGRGTEDSKKLHVKIHENIQHRCEVNLLPEYSFGFHFPNNGNLIRPGTILTMFRKPVDRLISAFLYDPRGGMLPAGYPQRDSREAEIHSQINNATFPIVAYANLPPIHSCQVKMLLGYPCGKDLGRELTDQDQAEAQRRLHHDLLAFGLTEDYPASFALFDAILAEQIPLEHTNPVQTTSRRIRKNSHNDAATHSRLQLQLEQYQWSDPHDDALYLEAAILFCDRCSTYNITTTIDCRGLKGSV